MNIFNNTYMELAFKQAYKAYSLEEIPVGAVIVDYKKNIILSKAHNLTQSTFDPTAHAEMIAIKKACKLIKSTKLVDCVLYTTLEPCPMCAQAISFTKIKRLYFAAFDKKGGGVDHGAKVFSSSSCHHKPEIYSGIMEEKSKLLLQSFFKSLRKA